MLEGVWWVRKSKNWIEFYRSKSDDIHQVVSPNSGGVEECLTRFTCLHGEK